jgi:hypothetical protein
MSQKAQQLVRASTNVIELIGLKDEVTGSYIDDATVTVALLDSTGTPVAGASAITMNHVTGTTGKHTTYRGTVANTVDLSGTTYTAKVVATKDASVRTFPIPATAVDLP